MYCAWQSFFTRWWQEQREDTKDLVRKLVDQGQLDFVNGGYVQHDEAAAHYVAMIDQTTLGHRYAELHTKGAVFFFLLVFLFSSFFLVLYLCMAVVLSCHQPVVSQACFSLVPPLTRQLCAVQV